ncbi:hypothetical protein K449DRAFT_428226 [Hypoxylon sp. EC38]|nr:hypothetical protein K449DRAFT_428226 [Hypoxylon sp. EC38]
MWPCAGVLVSVRAAQLHAQKTGFSPFEHSCLCYPWSVAKRFYLAIDVLLIRFVGQGEETFWTKLTSEQMASAFHTSGTYSLRFHVPSITQFIGLLKSMPSNPSIPHSLPLNSLANSLVSITSSASSAGHAGVDQIVVRQRTSNWMRPSGCGTAGSG